MDEKKKPTAVHIALTDAFGTLTKFALGLDKLVTGKERAYHAALILETPDGTFTIIEQGPNDLKGTLSGSPASSLMFSGSGKLVAYCPRSDEVGVVRLTMAHHTTHPKPSAKIFKIGTTTSPPSSFYDRGREILSSRGYSYDLYSFNCRTVVDFMLNEEKLTLISGLSRVMYNGSLSTLEGLEEWKRNKLYPCSACGVPFQVASSSGCRRTHGQIIQKHVCCGRQSGSVGCRRVKRRF